MNNYLLITLGHGASAIFVDNTTEKPNIIGYEQERLSRIKADSQFPIDAINEIKLNVEPHKIKGCTILISHWFNFTENNIPNKYISQNDIYWLKQISTDIKFVSPEFTHHDAHAYSAYAFYKYYCKKEQVQINHTPVYCIVADGFGNNEEVFSIYSVDLLNAEEKPKCIHRVYGYENSLGLFYQYATSFVGMKENQDEYKFLGYEAHINEVVDLETIDKIHTYYINSTVHNFIDNLLNHTEKISFENTNCIIDSSKLEGVKNFWYSIFTKLLKATNTEKNDSFKARCIIAYFIQQTVEYVLCEIIQNFGISNLCVAGGCFYNVKLNNRLLNTVSGYFSAMPLAGDQGAAIGMYEAEECVNMFPFDTLSFGKRRLYNFKKLVKDKSSITYISKAQFVYDYEGVVKMIAGHIANGEIVDLVTGDMEFGPRALCNTSTIFLPTTENVKCNNIMNKRNEVMPCAPICTYENAIALFDKNNIDRVIGSNRFMICTHEYKRGYSNQYGGVMHKKTLEDNTYTGRPQIVEEGTLMYNVLKKVEELTDTKCLVNTSFNAHGNPIVFDTTEIMQNFNFQVEHSKPGKSPILIVIDNK